MIFSEIKYYLSIFLILELFPNYTSLSNEYSFCSNIVLDGYFDDWNEVPSILDEDTDSKGKFDILSIKFSQNDNYLFFNIKFNEELLIQEEGNFKIYIDCDLNNQTGFNFSNIGADIVYDCSEKSGKFYFGNDSLIIRPSFIELCGMPSYSSNEFEFTISKFAKFKDSVIFSSDGVKFAFSVQNESDVCPDEKIDFLQFNFANCDQIPLIPIDITKENDEYLRIFTWNCLQDNIADTNLTAYFCEIIKLNQPDIMCFQELYETDEVFIKNLINNTFQDKNWYVKKQEYTDIILASKYPIKATKQLNGNCAYLLDLHAKYNQNCIVINCHLPAGNENVKRLNEIQNIIDFVKEIKEGSAELSLDRNSPIFIVGDMNLVGNSEQWKLLLNGEKVITDKNIDWDNSAFAEVNARNSNSPFCYTWSKYYSSYWPAKMDYIVFSDFSSQMKKSYTFNTEKLSEEDLEKFSLAKNASTLSSDHLPIIADFEIHPINSLEDEINNKIIINSTDKIIENNSDIDFQISIFNILGQKIHDGIIYSNQSQKLILLTDGIYFLILNSTNYNSKPIIKRVLNSGLPSVIVPIPQSVPHANQN
ncbi:MAG: hypothetical protein A2X64_11115 [Ignavibacteria bacterium GWF2_33_9]|nr:MAG: hypothetical protein A2X64_11115 [Ignavibacteria bacterium GWF2_33_9]